MPNLTAEEVRDYEALGRAGWEQFRKQDELRAEAAFRGQIGIFPGNPEPYVFLAMLEANRKNKDAAIAHLHDAVIRGFADMRRIERAEAWTKMGRPPIYLDLVDAANVIASIDRNWPGWNSLPPRPPESLDHVMTRYAELTTRIEEMSPALGPRLTRIWNKMLGRASGALIEAYVAHNPEATDLEQALEHLMGIYADGTLSEWKRLPTAATERLANVAEVVLEGFPESKMRPQALMAMALSRNNERDKHGHLEPDAAKAIRKSLEEIVAKHADSPASAAAIAGLIKTDAATDRWDDAAERFEQFLASNEQNHELVHEVRHNLGQLALRVGGVPDFEGECLDGESIANDAFKGKVVVLDFWATWCGPCTEEFPTLRKIDKKHGEDVVVVGINLDSTDDLSPEELRKWVAAQQVPGTHIYDGMSWDSEIVHAFGVHEIPFNVVVDPDGSVVAINQHGKKLEKAVREAIRTEE